AKSGPVVRRTRNPDYAALHPGYACYVLVYVQISTYGSSLVSNIAGRNAMRFSLGAAALLSILLASPTSAIDLCGGTKLMCTQPASTATFAAARISTKRDRCESNCRGSRQAVLIC